MKRLALLTAIALFLGSALLSTAEEAKKAEVGKPFIDFTSKTLKTDKFVFSEAIKGKTAVLKFGAVWCGWCKKMWDDMKKVHDEMGDKVVVVEVDIINPPRETEEIARKYNTEKGTPWEVVLDTQGISGMYLPAGSGIPHSLVIGPDGIIKKRIPGYKDFTYLKPLLEAVANGEELPPEPGTIGYTVPDFTLSDMDGKEFNLADALKKGPVVVKFGAVWAEESNKLQQMYNDFFKKHGKKTTVVEIDVIGAKSREGVIETKEKAAAFHKEKGTKYRVLYDEEMKVIRQFGLTAFTIVVLDKWSRINTRLDGEVTIEKLEAAVEEAEKAKKPEEKKPSKDKDKDKGAKK